MFEKATGSDLDEVTELVDEAEHADDLAHEARVKLALIDVAATVRTTVDEALTRLAAALRRQEMDRDEAEESIREMAFEDEP